MQEIKYLTQDEAGRFFSKISDRRDRAIFKLIYDFGLRASEVDKLTLKDLTSSEVVFGLPASKAVSPASILFFVTPNYC